MNNKFKRIVIILFIILAALAIVNRFLLPEPVVNPTFIYFAFIVLVWIALRKQAQIMDEKRNRKRQEENDKSPKNKLNE